MERLHFPDGHQNKEALNHERLYTPPFYSALIERFAYHNAIILPLFTTNSLFMELLYNYSELVAQSVSEAIEIIHQILEKKK